MNKITLKLVSVPNKIICNSNIKYVYSSDQMDEALSQFKFSDDIDDIYVSDIKRTPFVICTSNYLYNTMEFRFRDIIGIITDYNYNKCECTIDYSYCNYCNNKILEDIIEHPDKFRLGMSIISDFESSKNSDLQFVKNMKIDNFCISQEYQCAKMMPVGINAYEKGYKRIKTFEEKYN